MLVGGGRVAVGVVQWGRVFFGKSRVYVMLGVELGDFVWVAEGVKVGVSVSVGRSVEVVSAFSVGIRVFVELAVLVGTICA